MTDSMKAKIYHLKKKLVYKYGIKYGLVGTYSDELITRLRDVFYGGIPASILLLANHYCSGYCYDRALLMAVALEDMEYQVVDADVDGIRYNPNVMKEVKYLNENGEVVNEHYANHSYLEVFDNGRTLVIDTTAGLIFDKRLYDFLEHPVVTKINDKQATMDFIDYRDIRKATVETDKYAAPLLIPAFEASIDKATFYKERLRKEIKLHKERIHYDEICKEISDDMKRLGMFKKK